MLLSLPAAVLQPVFINIRGRAARAGEGRRSEAALAARFIDVFSPGMWQVLLSCL